MKKTLLICGFVLVSILVFAAGVLSTLNTKQHIRVISSETEKQNFYRRIRDSFLPKNLADSPISGQKTIVNGVEMDMWMGERRGSLQSGFDEISARWSQDVLKGGSIEKDNGFMYGVDPKKKVFYGLIGFGQKGRNTFIPYKVDLKKKPTKKNITKDLPYQIRDKDMLSIQSFDKNSSFEYYFYEEKMMLERAISYTNSLFLNNGWSAINSNDKVLPKGKRMSILKKSSKTVVLNFARSDSNRNNSLVAVLMGTL